DTIGFSSDEPLPEILTKEEYAVLLTSDEPEEEIVLDSRVDEGIFGLAQTNLEGYEKGWKLIRSDGDYFPVTILDKRFLAEVGRGKYSFVHGTAVKVKVRDITKKKVNITHEYEVLEVISLYAPDSKIPKIVRKEQKLLLD
ncbi:MAG: hypothetical protein M0Q92_15610, partial [Methanoregula sp.]|nr:hypothetical protein [Methanoregula sp.]